MDECREDGILIDEVSDDVVIVDRHRRSERRKQRTRHGYGGNPTHRKDVEVEEEDA